MVELYDFFLEAYSTYSKLDIGLEFLAFSFGIISVIFAKKENILVYPTGIICTPQCPGSKEINGVKCKRGSFNYGSCACEELDADSEHLEEYSQELDRLEKEFQQAKAVKDKDRIKDLVKELNDVKSKISFIKQKLQP